MIKAVVWNHKGNATRWMVTKRIDGMKWYVGTYPSREEAVEVSRLFNMSSDKERKELIRKESLK